MEKLPCSNYHPPPPPPPPPKKKPSRSMLQSVDAYMKMTIITKTFGLKLVCVLFKENQKQGYNLIAK